ncbi:uncharacterized protein RMCC_4817, partial [Mycolicibacterium canariasense]
MRTGQALAVVASGAVLLSAA